MYKSILVLISLVFIHYVLALNFPNIGSATHQFQDNIIKVEEYVYNPKDTVVVGTSLSARILYDSLSNVQSIAFGGGSPEAGLVLLQRMQSVPKVVLVEKNLITRKCDLRFIDNVTGTTKHFLCSYLPNFREKNKPICMFFGSLIKLSGINSYKAAVNVPEELLTERIVVKIKAIKEIPIDYVEYENRLRTLKWLMDSLEQRGSNFVLFNMPINKKLFDAEKDERIDSLLEKYFPSYDYNYLPCDTTEYMTTDGQHLSYPEQVRYTSFFKKAIKNIK